MSYLSVQFELVFCLFLFLLFLYIFIVSQNGKSAKLINRMDIHLNMENASQNGNQNGSSSQNKTESLFLSAVAKSIAKKVDKNDELILGLYHRKRLT